MERSRFGLFVETLEARQKLREQKEMEVFKKIFIQGFKFGFLFAVIFIGVTGLIIHLCTNQ